MSDKYIGRRRWWRDALKIQLQTQNVGGEGLRAVDRGGAMSEYEHEWQAEVAQLTAERDAFRAELETQRSRAEMWKARCNHGTDASELQPGEEAYERLRAENDRLRAEVDRLHKRQIERELEAERLRLEAAENKAYVDRLCAEGDRLLAELASERTRVLGEAELWHKVTCPQCKHVGNVQLKVPTLWQVAPGIASVTTQLTELREAAEAYVDASIDDGEAEMKLRAVLAKVST